MFHQGWRSGRDLIHIPPPPCLVGCWLNVVLRTLLETNEHYHATCCPTCVCILPVVVIVIECTVLVLVLVRVECERIGYQNKQPQRCAAAMLLLLLLLRGIIRSNRSCRVQHPTLPLQQILPTLQILLTPPLPLTLSTL